jgi:hypothetical protein
MTANRLSFGSKGSFVSAGLGLLLAFLVTGNVGCGSKGSGGSAGAGGAGACSMGKEGCACYGNDTCDSPLTCLSHLCVNTGAGTGGSPSTGGSTGNAGAPGSGGATASGGSVGTGSGGSSASGGSPGSGGSSSSSGGSPGSGGSTSSGGSPGSGGTPATGGATGTGGTPATGGATGTGGTPATGGAGGGPVAGPLQFVGGWVDATTNIYGIQGSIYTFKDPGGSVISPDCSTGAACFGGTTTPTTKFCVNGTDATVLSGDYTDYWGAAVGFDLNVPAGGTKTTYPAQSHNVVGFSMNLTNTTYPSDKVQFTYSVYNGSGTDQYCVQALNSGPNYVYFSNTQTLCYSTGGTPFPSSEVNGVVALQWQVSASPDGPVSFNYCIDSLTPIVQ